MNVNYTDSDVEDDVLATLDDCAAASAVNLLDLVIGSPPASISTATGSVAATTTAVPMDTTEAILSLQSKRAQHQHQKLQVWLHLQRHR